MTDVFINKVFYFSDMEINSLFDKSYVSKYAVTEAPHSHFNYEIQACINGEYIIEDNQQNGISMIPNKLCIIPAGYTHSSKAITDSPEMLAFCFCLKKSSLKNSDSGCFDSAISVLTKNDTPLYLYSEELTDLVKRIYAQIHSEGENNGIVSEFLLIQFFSSLFNAIIPKTKETPQKAMENNDNHNSRAYKIESFLYNNFSHSISEQDLADYLNLSIRQISREFKSLYALSFRKKLIDIRMTNAAKLLLRTDFSVGTIADKVGYSSNAGFCNSFKKFYGISPREYKLKYKQ